MTNVVVFALILLAYGLYSARLERSIVSPQMVFVAAGILLSLDIIDLVDFQLEYNVLLFLGEVALVIVLFTDAARIKVSVLKLNESLPARMLIIGMPLTIAAGIGTAVLIFSGLTFWECAIIATVLAPTDAGLTQAVVNSRRLPGSISQTINVESGLNDGIATPVLFLFLALAVSQETIEPADYWANFILRQIGLGVFVGLAIGVVGGWLVSQASGRGWMTDSFKWLSLPVMAITAWVLADLGGGNGFIAAFTGGLGAAWVSHGIDESLVGFSDTGGQLLDFAVFFIFGTIAIDEIGALDWKVLLYAVLSLTVIRMVPVAISLLASGLRLPSVLFLGWFGPRGLASIVLGLIVLDQAGSLDGVQRMADIVMATVILSVLVHGISVNPLIRRYGRYADGLPPGSAEWKEALHFPTRKASRPQAAKKPQVI